MGCFDSTCSLTRTSIHVGDKVLIVAVPWNAQYAANTYEFGSLLGSHLRYVRENKEMREKFGMDHDVFPLKEPLRFHGVGEYNDYGTIEGFDNDAGSRDPGVQGSWWDYQFMVHYDALVAFMDGEEYEKAENKLDYLKRFTYKAMQARVQLFGHGLLGAQHYDIEEVQLQTKLADIVRATLNWKSQQLVQAAWENSELLDLDGKPIEEEPDVLELGTVIASYEAIETPLLNNYRFEYLEPDDEEDA